MDIRETEYGKNFQWFLKSESSHGWYVSIRGALKREVRPTFDSHDDFLTLRSMGRNFRFVVEEIEHQFRLRAFDTIHTGDLVLSELQNA